ncbi:unnamed protein product [Lampetra fluviatilis]
MDLFVCPGSRATLCCDSFITGICKVASAAVNLLALVSGSVRMLSQAEPRRARGSGGSGVSVKRAARRDPSPGGGVARLVSDGHGSATFHVAPWSLASRTAGVKDALRIAAGRRGGPSRHADCELVD